MKFFLTILLGGVLYSQSAFALTDNIKIELKKSGKDYTSYSSIYYNGKDAKSEEDNKFIRNGKLNNNLDYGVRIYNHESKDYYFSLDGEKTYLLFKKTNTNVADILFGVATLNGIKLSSLINKGELDQHLKTDGFTIKKIDQINISGKNYECQVYEKILPNQFQDKMGNKFTSVTKIWVSNELLFPLKVTYSKGSEEILITEEVTEIKTDTKFSNDFFTPAKNAKIEVSKDSYDDLMTGKAAKREKENNKK